MKKVLSVLLALVMLFVLLPAGAFPAYANEDIACSRNFTTDEYRYEYVATPNAAAKSDYNGGVLAISNAISAVQASVDISAYGILVSQISGIFSNEICQNPAFFYFAGCSYTYYPSTNIVKTVTFTYSYSAAQIQQMKTAYAAAVAKALSCIYPGMTDFDKILTMHDYLILNAKYDYENYLAGTIPAISFSAYGVLVNGVGVCDGYALAFKDLLTRLGITVIKVNSETMYHSWNMVYLGGKWYHVDVTWDDAIFPAESGWLNNDYDLEGSVFHDNFLLSDAAAVNIGHSGWQPNTNTANSTIYDGDYSSIESGMFWRQGYWYYLAGSNLKRSLFDLSGSTVIKAVGTGSYCYLGAYNNKLYYNCTAGLKSYIKEINYDGTAETAIVTIDNTGSSTTERITEFVIQDYLFKYTVYRLPAGGSAGYAVRYYYPPINIYGVTANALYNTNVTITYSGGTALLDGQAFGSGSTVSAEGTHTITVTNTNGSSAAITFTVDKTAPVTPTFSVNPTAPTTGDVTVTVTFPADAAVKQYRLGAGAWAAYTAALVLSENNTVYAKCTDTAGNVSVTGSAVVGNIDKLVVRAESTAVINMDNNFIYGLTAGITASVFTNSFVRLIGNATLTFAYAAGSFGTGTKVSLVDNATSHIVSTYDIIIFGDVNGDGNIDTADTDMIIDIGSYALPQWNPATDAAYIKACDLFRDGIIDENDCAVLTDVQNYALVLDQRTGIVLPH